MKIDGQELKTGDRIDIISGLPVRKRWDLLRYLQMQTYFSLLCGQRKQSENGIYIVTSSGEMKDQHIKELEHDVNEFYKPLVEQLKKEIDVRNRVIKKLSVGNGVSHEDYIEAVWKEARTEAKGESFS